MPSVASRPDTLVPTPQSCCVGLAPMTSSQFAAVSRKIPAGLANPVSTLARTRVSPIPILQINVQHPGVRVHAPSVPQNPSDGDGRCANNRRYRGIRLRSGERERERQHPLRAWVALFRRARRQVCPIRSDQGRTEGTHGDECTQGRGNPGPWESRAVGIHAEIVASAPRLAGSTRSRAQADATRRTKTTRNRGRERFIVPPHPMCGRARPSRRPCRGERGAVESSTRCAA